MRRSALGIQLGFRGIGLGFGLHLGRVSSHKNGHAVYRSLPASFSGHSYYYDGHYYTGGDYQTGSYNHLGRRYTNRYNYKGTYMYGGRYQRHEPGHWTDSRHDTYRRGDYRH